MGKVNFILSQGSDVGTITASPPPNPVEQFNARRIAARARVDEDQDHREWNRRWEAARLSDTLAAAMSVPGPHDTDIHERIMPYRHRSE